MFDWIQFLRSRGIEYVERGPNVARGNVNIHCPWCGSADPSHHLGIAIDGSGWGCWRSSAHRGIKPHRLIVALIRCNYEEAAAIAAGTPEIATDLVGRVTALLSENSMSEPRSGRKEPSEFRAFSARYSAKPFVGYMRARGFSKSDLFDFCDRYEIRFSTLGEFKGRIIFLVREKGKLVNWTGRTIYSDETIRYKTLADKDDPITNRLLWYDKMRKERYETLVIAEGPFDALKVNYLANRYGVFATCLFTSSISESQVSLISSVSGRFKRKFILLDSTALSNALDVEAKLSPYGFKLRTLPEGVKDPGDLDRKNASFLRS